MTSESTLVRDLFEPGWREREAARDAAFLAAIPLREAITRDLSRPMLVAGRPVTSFGRSLDLDARVRESRGLKPRPEEMSLGTVPSENLRSVATTLCEQCFPEWQQHEVYASAPLNPCCQCGSRQRGHLFPRDPRANVTGNVASENLPEPPAQECRGIGVDPASPSGDRAAMVGVRLTPEGRVIEFMATAEPRRAMSLSSDDSENLKDTSARG
jgi:hypothetical protein